jgi:hypothetical protein
MSGLVSQEVSDLAQALSLLTKVKKDYGVDVRAYGDIDVEVRGTPGTYLRLTWNTEQDCYGIAERHQ